MRVRRFCLAALLIAGITGCISYKDWFSAYKSADQEAAAKRNPDWNKNRESDDIPGTD